MAPFHSSVLRLPQSDKNSRNIFGFLASQILAEYGMQYGLGQVRLMQLQWHFIFRHHALYYIGYKKSYLTPGQEILAASSPRFPATTC